MLSTTEIRFYHLLRTPLEAALPTMLERTLQRGQRAVVKVGGPDRLRALDAHLWTYNDRAFLPHGSARDGFAEDQPVWLTCDDENPNGAEVLFMTDGASSDQLDKYALNVLIFDGRDEQAVGAARGFWKGWKEAGHMLTYWQQTGRGWEKKASANDPAVPDGSAAPGSGPAAPGSGTPA